MSGVLSGFAVIWTVIAVGYFVGRTGVLGEHARYVLNRLTFFVASPALLFTTLADSDPSAVLGPFLGVAAASSVATAVVFILITRWWLRRDLTESTIGAMSASTVNSANLGLPIALYVLGDMAHAAPVILWQLALYSPVCLAILDSSTSRHRTTVISMLVQTLKNPMIVGSLAGLVCALFDLHLPQPLADPVELIAGASIPAMLIAFGISLVGSKPLEVAGGRRADTLVATAMKLVFQPVVAWVLALWVFGLESDAVFAAVIMAALPTAQNIFVTASRYERGIVLAKDTVLLTTIVAVPAMMVVPLLLA
ncbi:AEC family transporter [Paeniglutamicibacter gangotriensis]|uniref:Auxin efflux carrier (AEC) family transporter n=2 Tax=Paeniglutamicibacter gangotriensis TaxID=254787 RepID=M7MUW1_9MICC|nr:AEC family transporter [Paeniglutamicibacter gangotriensis]EMQ98806.1 auxin efflux carrier (AEC) family transporter [Paeniglutamicibacter gangotriensis Lz1y]KAA0973730.1 AEC family transporter [Paeniglutamicibacter gangotriensis]